jgi:hypothetical protein
MNNHMQAYTCTYAYTHAHNAGMDQHMTACLAAIKEFRVFNLAKIEQQTQGAANDNAPTFNACPYNATMNADNQRLGLLAAVLDDGNWPVAQWLLDTLAPLLPAAHPQVAASMCNLARITISRLYSSLPATSRPTAILSSSDEDMTDESASDLVAQDFAALEKTLMPIMRSLTVYVYYDPVLIVRICRIIKAQAYAGGDNTTKASPWLLELCESLIGALALLPQNAHVSWEIWEAVSRMDYLDRYLIYANVLWNAYNTHPELMLVRARVKNEMRKLLKGLTKENVAKKKRSLAKLSHSNPLIVLETILDQVQEYESMIEVCRDALAYSSSLTLDMFSYLAMEELGGALLLEKPLMQEDFANLSRWLLNFCDFVSGVYVRYPHTELRGMLVHVLRRLQADSFGELEILRQLIQKMTGFEELGGTLSQDMLMAKAAGEKLRQCIESPWPLEQLFVSTEDAQNKKLKAYQTMLRERKEASECLVAALESSGTGMALLVVLGQQVSGCMHTKASQETMQVKFTSWLHRQSHQTLQVLQDLLSRRLPASAYVDRLPPLEKLVAKLDDGGLGLDPEVLDLFVCIPVFIYVRTYTRTQRSVQANWMMAVLSLILRCWICLYACMYLYTHIHTRRSV